MRPYIFISAIFRVEVGIFCGEMAEMAFLFSLYSYLIVDYKAIKIGLVLSVIGLRERYESIL